MMNEMKQPEVVAHCGPALESFVDPTGALQKAGLLVVDKPLVELKVGDILYSSWGYDQTNAARDGGLLHQKANTAYEKTIGVSSRVATEDQHTCTLFNTWPEIDMNQTDTPLTDAVIAETDRPMRDSDLAIHARNLERDLAKANADKAVLVKALEGTYLAMLQVPTSNLARLLNQAAYAAVRDAVATATGREPEDVQNDFEARADLSKVQA